MRIRPATLLSALIFGSVVFSASASAVGLGFLADTPMAYLNKNDKPVFVKAVADALNDKKDGEDRAAAVAGARLQAARLPGVRQMLFLCQGHGAILSSLPRHARARGQS